MKTRFTLFVFLLLCLTGLNAQRGFWDEPVIPYQPNGSPIFGKDIIINDIPSLDQRHIAICSAFNGWLFSAYSYYDAGLYYVDILRSKDNGLTWSSLYYGFLDQYYYCTDLSIKTIGTDTSNLILFIGCTTYQPNTEQGYAFVTRFNGLTGAQLGEILHNYQNIHDLKLATDFPFPANNSTPSSLAVLYSVSSNYSDSVILCTSSNGGLSFDNHRVLAITHKSIPHVSLCYARSASMSSGRYYAAWEEKENKNSTLGHIYTSHTNPDYNSPSTTPIKLDSIDPVSLNLCRHPVISCQINNTDNDSANLSEIVLFEKYNQIGNEFDIEGYYNLQSTQSSYFKKLNLASTTHNEIQPELEFNYCDSTFMVTYYDSTTQKLPFLTKNYNLNNPDNWQVVNSGYNDESNLFSPQPKIAMNVNLQKGAIVWTKELGDGKGASMFDAPYSTYTGISGNSISTSAKLIGSYPNPCSNTIRIAFELKNAGKVTIDVMSIMGQPLGTVTDQNYPAGKQMVQCDVSSLPVGNYLYRFKSGDFTATGKFTVIK